MKNFFAPKNTKISIDNGQDQITFDLYSKEGFEMLSNLMIKVGAEKRLMYEASWLGRPIIQFPSDIIAIQELLWQIKPDFVIETGVAHGGSLILSASILDMIGHGEVIGIDIDIREHNRREIENHNLFKRIHLIEGSSIDQKIISKIYKLTSASQKVVVILDSNHSQEHVSEELRAYSKIVTPKSYIVVHDGAQAWVSDIPSGKKEWKDNHPLNSINNFLENNPQFSIDEKFNRWGVTSSPYGYILREY